MPKEPEEEIIKEPAFDMPKEPEEEIIKEPAFDMPKEPEEEIVKEPAFEMPKEPEEDIFKEPEQKPSAFSQDSLEKFDSTEPELKLLSPKPAMKISTKIPVKKIIRKPVQTFEPETELDDSQIIPPPEDVDEDTDVPELDDSELKTLLPEPELKTETAPEISGEEEPVIPPRSTGDDPPLERIARILVESHFKPVLDVRIDGIDIVVKSEQGKYEKIFVKYVEECTLDTVNDIEKIVDFYKGDIGIIVGKIVPELITAFTLPEKIRVFQLNDFEDTCRDRKLLSSN